MKRIAKDTHSPSVYAEELKNEIYQIFDSFRSDVVPNDDKLDYVTWISIIPG